MEDILPLRSCIASVAVLVLDIHSVYMIPTTNKIIQLSPYGLQPAIIILLTLNLTIYHIAQVLHFFVDESLKQKLGLHDGFAKHKKILLKKRCI